jgi:hypothetical protein
MATVVYDIRVTLCTFRSTMKITFKFTRLIVHDHLSTRDHRSILDIIRFSN